MPPTYTINQCPPPGRTLLSLRSPSTSSSQAPSPSLPQTWHDALAVRDDVFVVEQHCPWDEEIDAEDAFSWHWVVYAKDNDDDGDPVPAATIRLVPANMFDEAEAAIACFDELGPDWGESDLWDTREAFVSIGRVATRKEFRGRGLGRALVAHALGWAVEHAGDMVRDWPDRRGEKAQWKGMVLVHAQVGVEEWYRALGWRTDEGMGEWKECGIPHVAMWRRVQVKGLGGALEEKGDEAAK